MRLGRRALFAVPRLPAVPAQAQGWLSRPIRLIIPYATGGGAAGG